MLHKYSLCGSCVILLTLAVVCFTDETFNVWCIVIDLLNCWLSAVLTVLMWVVVDSVVIAGTGEELNASKISAHKYKACNKHVRMHITTNFSWTLNITSYHYNIHNSL